MTTKIMVEIEVDPLVIREAAFKYIERDLDALCEDNKWWNNNIVSFTVRAMLKKEQQGSLCDKCPFRMVHDDPG